VAKDATKTEEERMKALDLSNDILTKQIELEQELAKEKYDLIVANNALAKSGTEDLQAEADALTEFYNVQATLNKKIVANAAERQALTKEIRDSEQKDKEAAFEKDVERYRILADKANEAFDKEVERLELLTQAETKYLEDMIAAKEGNAFEVLRLEKKLLEEQYTQEIEQAEKLGLSTKAIDAKYSKARIDIAEAEKDAKLAFNSLFAGEVLKLFGEATAVGKAAAIAQTAIATYQGAQQAFASAQIYPAPWGQIAGIAAAGVVIANGIKAIRQITAVQSGLPGTGTAGGGGSISNPISPGGSTNVNPSIGQGIVTRSDNFTTSMTSNGSGSAMQTVLVENDVTVKQNLTKEQQTTSVI
jgi:hypothetical protein